MENPYVVAAMSGVVAAVVSTGLTYLTTVNAFRSQRWWEKKAETYTEILSNLYEIYDSLTKDIQEYYDATQGVRTIKSEKSEQEARELYKQAAKGIDKAIVIGSFTVSNKVSETLKGLKQKLSKIEHADSEYIFHAAPEYLKAIEVVIEEGREELNVQ